MNLLSNLLSWPVALPIVVGLLWFSLDMRSLLESGKRKHQLSIDGKWKELDAYFVRAERTCRPFAWLHQRYLSPGNIETQYASFLFKQGRFEEALAKVDQAIRRNKNKPAIFRSFHAGVTAVTLRGALRIRMLVLTSLGRYDESRAMASELDQLTAPRHLPNASLALLNLYCGRLDEAIAEAQVAAPEDSQYDSMRGVLANAYCYKGEFQKALESLSYQPADAFKFYSKEGLETLTQTPVGVELIALKRKKLARIYPPAQWLKRAHVYLAMEDFEKAGEALDEAAKSLGPEPGLQFSYARYRAHSFAGQRKSKETEEYIERMRVIARESPKRSTTCQCHYSTGRAYFYLGRHNDALAELMEAQRNALHPIEKHVNAFWIAKTHEALGRTADARPFYQQVATDTIPSRYREQAAAALNKG
jgi:tetratricopeptide (TPR) repeat protein